MSKERDKIIEALEDISIKFDELGFSPTIPIPKGDKAHFVDWFKIEIDTIKVATNKQAQRIAELEEQLAEKEEENLALAHIITGWDDYNQEKIDFAIEQLEKVKENILSNITFGIESVGILNSTDNQISQLKEMK